MEVSRPRLGGLTASLGPLKRYRLTQKGSRIVFRFHYFSGASCQTSGVYFLLNVILFFFKILPKRAGQQKKEVSKSRKSHSNFLCQFFTRPGSAILLFCTFDKSELWHWTNWCSGWMDQADIWRQTFGFFDQGGGGW